MKQFTNLKNKKISSNKGITLLVLVVIILITLIVSATVLKIIIRR